MYVTPPTSTDLSTASPTDLVASQTSTVTTPTLSTNTTNAITGVTSKVPSVLQGINGNISTISNKLTVESFTASVNNSGISKSVLSASNQLESALKSITSTFTGGVKTLASGIDSALSGLFKNTDIKTASNAISQISDPVKTNLLGTKKPNGGSFIVSSLESGSQSLTATGVDTAFGTKADSMVGTNLSTVLNRLSLDSISTLSSTISNNNANTALKGLFSSVKTATTAITSTVGSVVSSTAQVSKITTGLVNDVKTFTGQASTLATALGQDPLQYFVYNPSTTLVDQTGTVVNTNSSGVDANTANSIISLVRLVGCNVNDLNYSSATANASLFNFALSAAALSGLSSLVSSLLGCSAASSDYGQTAITTAFVNVAGVDSAIASTLLESVDNPALLDTDTITTSIVTNPNLSISNISQVNSILDTLGSSTTAAYSVSSASIDTTPVYNLDTISKSTTSYLDGVFGDSTLSTYLNGSTLSLNSSGILSL